jgi:hypothetical protein
MKKLHIIALSMLISTSAVIMQATCRDDYDATHHLDKQRNNNTYDGSGDACEGQFRTDDSYDQRHRLNKKRNSKTHPVCSSCCVVPSEVNLILLDAELENDMLNDMLEDEMDVRIQRAGSGNIAYITNN